MSVYVGIDVHRKRSQVAVVTEDGTVELSKNVVNGSEPMLRLIGDLPPGTPVASGAAFGWGWLAPAARGLRLRGAPGAPAAVQGDRLGQAEERPVNRTAGRFRSSAGPSRLCGRSSGCPEDPDCQATAGMSPA